MEIAKGTVVELEYELYLGNADGELIEETQSGEPFTFLFGYEEILDKLANSIAGKVQGEAFSIAIPCDEAYGQPEEGAIAEFPKDLFRVDGKIDEQSLAVGELVPMRDDEGNEIEGFVLENNAHAVTLDFNHPLAGEDLFFQGRVLAVRKATEAEKDAGEASISL